MNQQSDFFLYKIVINSWSRPAYGSGWDRMRFWETAHLPLPQAEILP